MKVLNNKFKLVNTIPDNENVEIDALFVEVKGIKGAVRSVSSTIKLEDHSSVRSGNYIVTDDQYAQVLQYKLDKMAFTLRIHRFISFGLLSIVCTSVFMQLT